MQHIQSLLEEIGLNHYESTVYVQLLQTGQTAASVLATKTTLPRSTVRGVLNKLCERGIVQKLYKRNTQYYQCKDPSSLVHYMQHRMNQDAKRLEHIQAAVPQLQAMVQPDSIIPKVRYYEGEAGVIEAFNHSLFEQDIAEILFFTSYAFIKNTLIVQNDDDFYIPLRKKKGIYMRVLVGTRKELDPRKKYNDALELRERRYIPANFDLPGNIHIYGNFVVYFSAQNTEYMAVLVESKMMADTMRALFEFMWEKCE